MNMWIFRAGQPVVRVLEWARLDWQAAQLEGWLRRRLSQPFPVLRFGLGTDGGAMWPQVRATLSAYNAMLERGEIPHGTIVKLGD
jgi:hypothetical protein